MKTLLVFIVSIFFAIQTSAQEQGKAQVVGPKQSHVQWIHYLSEMEKIEIGRKLVMEELRRLEATGQLYEEMPQREISFPASFKRLNPASTDARSAAATRGGGNLSCLISVATPHAGKGPGNSRVVKAKSNGTCSYAHVFGELPPTVGWDLQMYLIRIGHGGRPSTETHPRDGRNAFWGDRKTQVFSPTCINDRYSHANVVWVTPPQGWEYTGPQPITIPTIKTNELDKPSLRRTLLRCNLKSFVSREGLIGFKIARTA